MKHLIYVVAAWLAVATATAAPTLTSSNLTNAGILGKRDKAIKITAMDVDPKAGIIWRFDKNKLDCVVVSKTVRYFVGPAGVYTIEVWTVVLDAKTGETVVDSTDVVLTIVEDGKPVDPVKPDPPTPPVPPTPVPTDPLVKAIQDGYTQDQESDKADLKTKFAAMFAAAADDKILDAAKNTLTLFNKMGELATAFGFKGKIQNTQAAVEVYLNTVVAPSERPMTPSLKAKIKNEFTKVAKALGEVK